jgi:translation initiation factor 3 subunit L
MEDFAQLSRDLPIFRLRVEGQDCNTSNPNPYPAFQHDLEVSLRKGDEAALLQLYDLEFNRLTNQGLNPLEPSPSLPGEVRLLYSELFYRWAHSKTLVTVAQREAAFLNYLELFMYLKGLQFSFPAQWLWDMIDEFLFQFQSYWLNSHQLPASLDGVWDTRTVQRVLHELVLHYSVFDGSTIGLPPNKRKNEGLGYFAYYGQVRLQSQLGDFAAAVKTLQGIKQPALQFYKQFPACYISLCYYAGHAFFAQGRVVDSVVILNNALSLYSLMRPFLVKSYLYHILVKKAEQALALLAIGYVICPFDLAPAVTALLRLRLGDKFVKLQKGEDISVFEELFQFSAPKWVSPDHSSPSPYWAKFVATVGTSLASVKLLSYARIYRSVSLSKLQQLTGLPPDTVASIASKLAELARSSVVADGFSEEGKLPAALDIEIEVEGDKLVCCKHSLTLPVLGLLQHQHSAVSRVLTQLE